MKKKRIVTVIVLGGLFVIAVIVFLATVQFDTTLEFTLVDSVSRGWVWDARIEIQDRFTKTYFQSDSGPVPIRFNRLAPGKARLLIDAPHYTPQAIDLEIKSGRNVVGKQIELVGYEIPGVREMFMYKERDADTLLLNPRAIDAGGKGIGRHPCLDMWFGLRISVQKKNGIFAREPSDTGSERGEEIFRGKIDWTWDPAPEEYYRYKASLPIERITQHNAPFNVYDYMIVFPDPRKIKKDEFVAGMEKTFSIDDPSQLKVLLDSYGDRITYFLWSDWNQPAF